jgi:hypothetical protein
MEKLCTKLTEIHKKIQNSKSNISPSGKSWISSKNYLEPEKIVMPTSPYCQIHVTVLEVICAVLPDDMKSTTTLNEYTYL